VLRECHNATALQPHVRAASVGWFLGTALAVVVEMITSKSCDHIRMRTHCYCQQSTAGHEPQARNQGVLWGPNRRIGLHAMPEEQQQPPGRLLCDAMVGPDALLDCGVVA
jgi:hypothetical protein